MAAHKIIDTRGVELIQDSISSTVPRIQQNGLNQFNLLLEAGSLDEGQSKNKGGTGGEHLRNMLLGVQHAPRQNKGHGTRHESKTGSILISLVRILWRGRSAVLRAKAAVGLRAVFACKRSFLLFAFQELKLLSILDRVVSQMEVSGMASQSGAASNPESKDDEQYMRVNVTALLRQSLACGASVLHDIERVLNAGGAGPQKSRQAGVLAEAVKDFEIVLFLLSSSCLRIPLLQSTSAVSVLSRCLALTDEVSTALGVQVQQALLLALEAAVQHPEVLECCWADVVMDLMPALARNFVSIAETHSVPSETAAEQLHVLALKLYVDVMSHYVVHEQDNGTATLTGQHVGIGEGTGASDDTKSPQNARQVLAAALSQTNQELVLPHFRALLSARDPAPHYMLRLVSISLSCNSTGSAFGSTLAQLQLLEPIVGLLQSRVHAFHGDTRQTLMFDLPFWCHLFLSRAIAQ